MADYADVSEIEEIQKRYANYPPIRDISGMCREVGVEIDGFRTIEEADAWAYYHELKAMVDQQQRKTA
jgi:hypothetical protein